MARLNKNKHRLISKVTGEEISVESVSANLESVGLFDKKVTDALIANKKHISSIVPTPMMLKLDKFEKADMLRSEFGHYVIELAYLYADKGKMTGEQVAKSLLDCIFVVLGK